MDDIPMAFFTNSAVNRLNLHYGIHAIALTGGGAFFSAYLLKAGLSLPWTLFTFAIILAGRFAIRPILILLAARWGVRRLVVAGTLLSSVQYTLLVQVHGLGAALFALCLMSSLADTLYWPTYHAYFAFVGDHEQRGQQIGAREAIAAIIGVISPLVTGWLLVRYGAPVAFYLTACVVALAALPLVGVVDMSFPARAPGAFRAAIPGVLLFMTDGWVAAGYVFVWQVALFLSLGENFLAFGGALAVAAVVGAVSGMVLGRHIDAGHGRRAVFVAYGVIALIIVIRALALKNPVLAVVANALGALGGCLYVPTMMTAIYNQAKRAPCTLRFHIAAEAGWDLGGATGLSVSALLVWLGFPLYVCVLISLFGVAAGFVLLQRYYGNNPGLAIDTGAPPIENQMGPP
jgi:hypothetical protein